MANLGDISKIQLPNGNVVNIKDASYTTEILSINITSLTWTASGQGMYYSSEIPLSSIQTILGWCVVEINGLKPENWFIPSQNTTGLGKFRLLTGSDNFYSGANLRIRLFGSTKSLS